MKISFVVFCMLFASAAYSGVTHPSHFLKGVPDHRDGIFQCKVSRDLVGATIAVYSPAGIKLTEQTVHHRKVVIDFYYEPAGTYTIYVKKDGKEQAFQYTKTAPDPSIPADKSILVDAGSII